MYSVHPINIHEHLRDHTHVLTCFNVQKSIFFASPVNIRRWFESVKTLSNAVLWPIHERMVWSSVGRYVHTKLSQCTLVRKTLELPFIFFIIFFLHGYARLPASSCVALMANCRRILCVKKIKCSKTIRNDKNCDCAWFDRRIQSNAAPTQIHTSCA